MTLLMHPSPDLSSVLAPTFASFPITVLLIDDQPIIAEAIKQMLAEEKDLTFHYCSDPLRAIAMAEEVAPTVILQDLVMPQIDGLTLTRYLRAHPMMREVPMIVLSSEENPKVKAEAFSLGANDYIVKLPDKAELVARIRYHSMSYIRLLERNEAYEKIKRSQEILNEELREAANYVRALLPEPLEGVVETSWRFVPCLQLGGDAFGYHWLSDKKLALYLLDVCGHGVGAALLSISAMNLLRSHSLHGVDFSRPREVLSGLNEAFPMERHNNMFFTIWYGVADIGKRCLSYASGGHPPAVLLGREGHQLLKTPGLVIGASSEVDFKEETVSLEGKERLYLFSDGIYEIEESAGKMLEFPTFVEELERRAEGGVEAIIDYAETLNGSPAFADDLSLLEVAFHLPERKRAKTGR